MLIVSKLTMSPLIFFISSIVFFIILSVLNPKISNFTKPSFSISSLSNCVTNSLLSSILYSGTNLSITSGEITIPAACLPGFLGKPSSFLERSMRVLTSSFDSYSFFKSLFCLIASSIVISTEKGIILAILSTYKYGKPITLPTSLIACFAINVP